jgi:hypothetical protein
MADDYFDRAWRATNRPEDARIAFIALTEAGPDQPTRR